MTSLPELADLVHRMREAQKRYFANRTPDNLRMSKVLESQVDRALASIRNGQEALL